MSTELNIGYTLASLNASLNALSGILLLLGFVAIRRKNPKLHKKFMGAAFLVSIVFLVSYVTRLKLAGTTHYPGSGMMRTVYLTILTSHIILAMAVPVMAILAIYRALKNQLQRHRKIAKVLFPIWIYVSVTGVLIYFMLYHWAKPDLAL